MELTRIVHEERPSFGRSERWFSIYSLSPEEIELMEKFSDTKNLVLSTYRRGDLAGWEELQGSARIIKPIIASIWHLQEIGGCRPTVWGGEGLTLGIEAGPVTVVETEKRKISLTPHFNLEYTGHGVLEAEAALHVGDNNDQAVIDILVEAYKKHFPDADGREAPIIDYDGRGAAVAEIRRAGLAIAVLRQLHERLLPLSKLEELERLKKRINDEGRGGSYRDDVVLEALRNDYERKLDLCLFPRNGSKGMQDYEKN